MTRVVSLALCVLLMNFLLAVRASADAVFPFTSLTIEHVVYVATDKLVFDSANIDDSSDDYTSDPGKSSRVLDVFEGGKLLTWGVAGDFAGTCNIKNTSSTVALVYVPGSGKTAPINCDGVEVGLGGTARRTLAGNYQTTTSVSGNTVEFTGVFTGRYQFYDRPSNATPTFDGSGSVRQHGKFQITQAGCRVLIYETESNVREDYFDGDRHEVKDKTWVERTTPETECHFKK